MALLFHDGFETGGADAWSSVTGTPSFHADYAHTGNYGMRCDASGSAVYVSKLNIGSGRQRTFYLYINSLPDSDCYIFVPAINSGLVLTTDGYIDFYVNAEKKEDGTVQLAEGQFYRISFSSSSSNESKLYINGVLDWTSTTVINYISILCGVISDVTANLYFDDVALGDTDSSVDIGNVLTLGGRPVGEGTDDDNYTLDEHGWADHTESADAVCTELDADPPNTTDYNISYGDAGNHRYSVTMDECGSGNLADIGGSDEILAVNFMWYYETDGGGSDDYGIRIRCSDDPGGTPTDNDNIDDPKDPTWLSGYHADTPGGANSWTQAYVNSLEMGMATVSSGGKELWWHEAYAMVAFIPSPGTIVQPSALSLSASIEVPSVDIVQDVTVQPSVLGITVSLVSPVVTAEVNATAQPTALSGVLALVNPTINFDFVYGAPALSLDLSLVDPAVKFDYTVEPGSQGLTLTIEEPGIHYDYLVTATALALEAAFEGANVKAGITVTASAQALSLTLNSPVLKYDMTVQASAIEAALSLESVNIHYDYVLTSIAALSILSGLQAPTVNTTAGVVVYPSVQGLSLAIQAPGLNFDYQQAVTALEIASSLVSPGIHYDYKVAVGSALAVIAELLDPTIEAVQTIIVQPSAQGLSITIHDPSTAYDFKTIVDAIGMTAEIQDVSVSCDWAFDVSALDVSLSLNEPVVCYDYLLSVSSLGVSATLNGVTMHCDYGFDVSALDLSLSLNEPVISTGNVIAAALFYMLKKHR